MAFRPDKLAGALAALSLATAVEAKLEYGSRFARYAGSSIPYVKNYVDSREQVEARSHADCRREFGEEDLALSKEYPLRVVKVDANVDLARAEPEYNTDHELRISCVVDVDVDTVFNQTDAVKTGRAKKKRNPERQLVFEGNKADTVYMTFVNSVAANGILEIEFAEGQRLRERYWSIPRPKGLSPIYFRSGGSGKPDIVYIDRDGLPFVSMIAASALPAAGSGTPRPIPVPAATRPAGS